MGSLWDPFGKFVVGLRALAAGLRSFEIGLQTLKIKLRSWEFGFRGFLAVASVCVQGPRTLIGRAWTVAGIHWELFVLYTKSIGKSMLCTQKIIGNCMFRAQESLGTVCFLHTNSLGNYLFSTQKFIEDCIRTIPDTSHQKKHKTQTC